MIKCNIGMVYFNSIVRNGGKELRNYNELSEERKAVIINKFWISMIKFILLNKLSECIWKEPEAKDKVVIQNLFENIPDAIVLKGRKQDDKAYLAFTVSYNAKLCTAEIVPYVVAKDEKTEERLVDKVSQDFITIEKFLSKKITKEQVIKFAFETFYGQRVCSVRGDDAVSMYKIMLRAIKHYPKFAELSDDEKMEIIRKGYRKGMRVAARERDVYTFARATFEVIEISGLAKVLYKYDLNLNKHITYERWGQSPNCLPKSNCPRFINYEFKTKSGAYIKTSFLAFDLWEILAKNESASAA